MNKKYNRISVYFKESNPEHQYVLERLKTMRGSRSDQIVTYLYQAMNREEESPNTMPDIKELIREEVKRQLSSPGEKET